MTTPAEPPPSTTITDEDFKRLRDQVDDLQNAANEAHIPWYRRSSSWMSIVALLFSVFTFFLSQYEQANQARMDEFRQRLVDLVTLRIDYARATKKGELDAQGIRFVSAAFNAKCLMLLDGAADLARRLGPRHISSAQYSSLAQEMAGQSLFADAVQMEILAVQAATNDTQRANTRYDLASTYAWGDRSVQDAVRADQLFREAATYIEKYSDAYSRVRLGNVYAQWGLAQIATGASTDGEAHVAEAKAIFAQYPNDTNAASAAALLNQNLQSVTHSSAVTPLSASPALPPIPPTTNPSIP
jgi:hypothetical protein